jgi:hypothetical protein
MKAFAMTAVVIAGMVAVLGAAPASAQDTVAGKVVIAGAATSDETTSDEAMADEVMADDAASDTATSEDATSGEAAPEDATSDGTTPDEGDGGGAGLRPVTSTKYEYKYINVSRTYNYTAKSRQLAVCKVLSGAGGGTCTMSQSFTVESRVDVSFGLTQASVGATIGITAGMKVEGLVSWTSPKAPAGSEFKAWAVGTRVKYQIQKWKISKAGGITARTLVATSDVLTGFQPVHGFAVGQ